jgi:hypothetical protein
MALALRQAIDGAVLALSHDPEYDVIGYCRELVELFDRPTRLLITSTAAVSANRIDRRLSRRARGLSSYVNRSISS